MGRIKRADLRVGDTIKITLTGTVSETYSTRGCTQIRDESGFYHYVYVTSPKVTGESSTPFRPVPGEVYKVGERGIWLCVTSGGKLGGDPVLVSLMDRRLSPEEFSRIYKNSFVKVYPV